jgi:hypothetical protein
MLATVASTESVHIWERSERVDECAMGGVWEGCECLGGHGDERGGCGEEGEVPIFHGGDIAEEEVVGGVQVMRVMRSSSQFVRSDKVSILAPSHPASHHLIPGGQTAVP